MHTTRLHKYFAVSFYRLNDIDDDDGDTGFILEVGQLGSNGFPSVILGSPFSRNGVQERGTKSKKKKMSVFWDLWHSTWVRLAGRCAAILEYSGQLKKPGLELLQNPGCLSGEIMTQTKKRKANETVRGYKSSK